MRTFEDGVHADTLMILAEGWNFAHRAQREPTDALRKIGGRMASKPLSVFKEPGRRRHRRWAPAGHDLGLSLVIALAIVGLVALVLLVLGLLDVHAVTRHFDIH